jgi:hypothetical protein
MAAAVLAVAGCTGSPGSSSSTAPSESAPTTVSSYTSGTAEVTYSGKTMKFQLDNCSSSGEGSLQAAGRDDSYVLTIDVQSGVGDIIVATASDVSQTADGTTNDFALAADGSFSATGSFPQDQGQTPFSVRGSCS